MSARPRINGLYHEPQVLEHEFKKHTNKNTTNLHIKQQKGTFSQRIVSTNNI